MKTIVITGGNSGIGYEACLQLASLNHRIIMICRNEMTATKACKNIKEKTSNQEIYCYIADLSNFDILKETIATIIDKHKRIDVLINNAADFDLSKKIPEYNHKNIEKQFATNVIAPFILSELFMPILQETKGKIINISSLGLVLYPDMRLDFENLNAEKRYSPSKTYYQNKLALLMVSLFMREKYPDVKVQAIRVPNVKINIDKYKNIPKIMKYAYKIKSHFSISPSTMAEVYVKLSIDDFEEFLYDEKLNEVKANKATYNQEDQKRLYDLLLKYESDLNK
ncbi:MAG: SDR family NAD(P)-dependent oxidoreductase [Erysipelotrichaceae bacterium]